MRKLLLSLALLSMTSLLFVACGTTEEVVEEVAPAEEEVVAPEAPAEEATEETAEVVEVEATDGEAVEGAVEVQVDAEASAE